MFEVSTTPKKLLDLPLMFYLSHFSCVTGAVGTHHSDHTTKYGSCALLGDSVLISQADKNQHHKGLQYFRVC